jgi:ribosomal protein L35
MSDKSQRHAMSKKSTKSIKEKRRDKRAAQAPASQVDKVMHPKRG